MRTHHSQHSQPGAAVQMRQATSALQPRLAENQIRAIYRFMYQRVGNREDAERLTERACVETLRAARDLPGEHTLEKSLWRTACAVVAEHLRWFYDAPAAFPEDIPDTEKSDAATRARDIMTQLPQRERELLARRFLANDSLAEAAAALHMTPGEAQALQWFALLHAAQLGARQEQNCCA